jgi:hypothetical protein
MSASGSGRRPVADCCGQGIKHAALSVNWRKGGHWGGGGTPPQYSFYLTFFLATELKVNWDEDGGKECMHIERRFKPIFPHFVT